MTDLFTKFIKTGLYLRGRSPKTSLIYKRALTSFEDTHEHVIIDRIPYAIRCPDCEDAVE